MKVSMSTWDNNCIPGNGYNNIVRMSCKVCNNSVSEKIVQIPLQARKRKRCTPTS